MLPHTHTDLHFFTTKCICRLCVVIQIVVYSWHAQLNSSVSHVYFPRFSVFFSCCRGRGFRWREEGAGMMILQEYFFS